MNIYVRLAKQQEIETTRLRLRPFSMKDTEDMFEYSSVKSNLEFVFPAHRTKLQVEAFIANHFMKQPLGKWAIELKTEQKMIGFIQFTKLAEQDSELSYVLNKNYWNQGLMTEALETLTNICLHEIGLKAISLHCDSRNYGSIQVAKKVGYKRAGQYKASNQYNIGRISQFEKYTIKNGNKS